MARRRESGLDLLIALPWYVGAVIAGALYVGAPMIAGLIAGTSPILSKSHLTIEGLLRLLSYVVAAAAVLSALRRFFVRRRFAAQRSLADLRALTWQQFEVIVGEAFRRQGYSVVETGQGGADGGVDLQLTRAGKRYLVQCKQYRASTVSVMVVREIFGVVAARKADGAIVVTTGAFTNDAADFAKGQPIELIDGRRLEAMVRDINGVGAPAASARVEPDRRSVGVDIVGNGGGQLSEVRQRDGPAHTARWRCCVLRLLDISEVPRHTADQLVRNARLHNDVGLILTRLAPCGEACAR